MNINVIDSIMREGEFSIFCDGEELVKNISIIQIDAKQMIPPFDHFVYSFEAMCETTELQYFHAFCSEGIITSKFKYSIKMKDVDFPIYIDSYSVSTYPNDNSMTDSLYVINQTTICGHFDSRDFQDKIETVIEKVEKINNRFEILDL